MADINNESQNPFLINNEREKMIENMRSFMNEDRNIFFEFYSALPFPESPGRAFLWLASICDEKHLKFCRVAGKCLRWKKRYEIADCKRYDNYITGAGKAIK